MNKKIKIILIVIILILSTSLATWQARGWWDSKNIQNAYKTALLAAQNIDQGKINEVYQNTTPEFQSVITKESFNESMQSLSSDELSVKELGNSYEGIENSLIVFDLENKKQEVKGTLTVYIIKENDKWLISDIYITK